ncbi:unnamed protein product [Lactuca saligna]|uniref:Uncharacterized protein n=1 Tax=Lactuca saligna TaxID=75948 RepID=A0AA35ZKF0_LACSI|nr:unnamed protein product [Lactuca saligna]
MGGVMFQAISCCKIWVERIYDAIRGSIVKRDIYLDFQLKKTLTCYVISYCSYMNSGCGIAFSKFRRDASITRLNSAVTSRSNTANSKIGSEIDALDVFLQLPHKQYNTGWVLFQVGKAHFELVDYLEAERAFSNARLVSPYSLDITSRRICG